MKKTLYIILSLCCCYQLQLHSQSKPNVVVILADDMGFSDIGCYGGEIQTPNIDALANDGIRFRRFYNTTKCSPTRAALLTGQYPHEAGMENLTTSANNSPVFLGYLPDNVVTMAEVFKFNGYGTYMSGKWHIGENQGNWPRDRGFDRYWGLISGASSYFELISMSDNPNQRSDRKMAYNSQLWDPDDTNDPNNPYVPGEFYMTDATSDFAKDFLQEHLQNQPNNPFFLYLSYTAPHWPLHAHESDVDKYDGAYTNGFPDTREQRLIRMKNLGIVPTETEISPLDHTVKWSNLASNQRQEYERRMQVYAAQTDRMDQSIGDVIQFLKNNNRFDNTIFVFLSDNGGSPEDVSGRKLNDPTKAIGEKGSYLSYLQPWSNVSNAPFRRHKNDTYEGGILTPLIIQHTNGIPAANRGQFTDQIGHVKDILPTLLDMTNSNYPTNYNGVPIKSMSGESFNAGLQDLNTVDQREVFFEFSGRRAVRHGKWKIVSDATNGVWSLFDLEDDPTELGELNASYPDVVDQLDKRYELWETTVGHQQGNLPNVNNAPVLATPIDDQIVDEGRLFTFVFDKNTFTDDPNDDLVYEATLSNGQALPSWLSFDDLLRQFSGIPPSGSLPMTIRLTAVDWAGNRRSDDFQLISSAQNSGGGLKALMIVNEAASINQSDADIQFRLEMSGYEVTLVSDQNVNINDAQGKDIVLISATVNSALVTNTFENTEVGVLVWEVGIYDDMKMTGSTTHQDFGGKGAQNSIVIDNDNHPLAGGLEAGQQAVLNASQTIYFGVPSPDAYSIATQVGNTERKTIFAYDVGDNMINKVAPGRRVGFYTGNNAAAQFNDNGWALFDATVCWLSQACYQESEIDISFVEPMDMEAFDEGSDVIVEVNAVDHDGLIMEVRLTMNGTPLRTLTNPPYRWNASTDSALSDMSPGEYELEATAYDNSGFSETTTITFTIEPTQSSNIDPKMNFRSPRAFNVFDAGHDLEVIVSASDPDGVVDRVMLYLNGNLVNADLTHPYEWRDAPMLQNLTVGIHNLRAVTMDNDGSSTEISIDVEVRNSSPNIPPQLSFVQPTDGQNIQAGTDLTVRLNAQDNDGSIADVKLFLDGQMVGQADNVAPYEWENEPLLNNLAVGTYTLRADATDNLGATTSSSIQFTVTAIGNNILPQSEFLTPMHGEIFPVGVDLEVEVNATDEDGSVQRVHLYLNDALLRKDGLAPYAWDGAGEDVELSNLQAGVYKLEAVPIDNRNQYSVNTINITVGDNNQPNESPTVNFIMPMDGANFPVGSNVYVLVDAMDADGAINQVDLYLDDEFVRTEQMTPYEWGLESQDDLELESMQAGTYYLKAIAQDNVGASSETTIVFTVGDQQNTPPSLQFDSPSSGARFEENENINVSVTANDTDGEVTEVRLYQNDQLVSVDNSSPYQWTLTNLPVGTTILRAVAVDDLGATNERMRTIHIDPVAQNMTPRVSFITPQPNTSISQNTELAVQVSASDSDGSVTSVDLYIDGQFVRSDGQSPYTWSPSEGDSQLDNLSIGTHTLQAIATDNEGATAQQTITFEVTAPPSATAPIVSFVDPTHNAVFDAGTDLYVQVDAQDPNGQISYVRLWINDELVRQENGAPYEWGKPQQNDILLQNLSSGNYVLRALARDNHGEETEETLNFSVRQPAGRVSIVEDDAAIASRSEQLLKPFQVELFPNPVDEQLLILTTAFPTEQSVFIRLLDAFGRVLKQRSVDLNVVQETFLNVSMLSNGVYFLEIRSADERLDMQKVVISH
ncbi:MAG: Ig-like domain-containing protein [Bacteroidota bacterium]